LRDETRLDFSFSGLKTAVRYQIAGQGMPVEPSSLSAQTIADLAASFQQAVIDCLVGKSLQGLRQTGLKTLCVAGGVAANKALRQKLDEACRREGVALFVPSPSLCTDNAVMGAIAVERFRAGLFESLDLDAYPGLVRGNAKSA
jgi:N6-L-threonylcarbamoyladenine synthase